MMPFFISISISTSIEEETMERNANNRRPTLMEEVAVFSCLVLGQFLSAVNSAFLNYLQDLGLPSSSIIIFSSLATFLLLSPPSIYFERDKWPKKLSFKLLVYIVLSSLAGATLFQGFLLEGIKLTSPVMANAFSNLCPGIVFIISAVFRFENADLKNVYTGVKITGTLLCICGAIMMSIFRSTVNGEDVDLNLDKFIGYLYLALSMVSMSFSIVLQGLTLRDGFSTPISLCAITTMTGMVITATIELIQNHKLETGSLMINSTTLLIGYYILEGAILGWIVSISLWALKKKGPVLVSMLSPLATVFSIILSYFTSKETLGEIFTNGSLIGMLIMFAGLYFFLWAKKKEEGRNDEDSIEHKREIPLLS